MRFMYFAPLMLAVATAGCGETGSQRTATGAVGGGVAGAVVGGPVGAVVGAGIGGAAGANREEIDEATDRTVDKAANEVAQADSADPNRQRDRQTSDNRAAGEQGSMSGDGQLTNDEVRQAQSKLADLGYYDGQIDGIYGRRSVAAVGAFQREEGLPTTRALDNRTQLALQQQNAGSQRLASNGSTDRNATNRQSETQGRDAIQNSRTERNGQTGAAGGDARTATDEGAATQPDRYGSYAQANDATRMQNLTVGENWSAESVIGAAVVDANDRTIGEIEDLLIDADGKVTAALIGVEQTLGVGTRTIAVDLGELNRSGDGFATDMTQEDLAKRRQYVRDGDSWRSSGGTVEGGTTR